MFLEENLYLNLSDLLKPFDLTASETSQKMQNALLETDEEALKIDHAALFIGPFEMGASPYGSIYLDQEQQVMGESTFKVKQFYQDAGLQVNQKEPPDHIAIELEFMSYLFRLEIEAIQKRDNKEQKKIIRLQETFFQTILYPWVPELCKKIEDNAKTDFYKYLASILRLFSKEMVGKI